MPWVGPELPPLVVWIKDIRREVDRLTVLSQPRKIRQRENAAADADGLHPKVVKAICAGGVIARAHGNPIGAGAGKIRIELDEGHDITMVDPVVDRARVGGGRVCRQADEQSEALWIASLQDPALVEHIEADVDRLKNADSGIAHRDRLIGWGDVAAGDSVVLMKVREAPGVSRLRPNRRRRGHLRVGAALGRPSLSQGKCGRVYALERGQGLRVPFRPGHLRGRVQSPHERRGGRSGTLLGACLRRGCLSLRRCGQRREANRGDNTR